MIKDNSPNMNLMNNTIKKYAKNARATNFRIFICCTSISSRAAHFNYIMKKVLFHFSLRNHFRNIACGIFLKSFRPKLHELFTVLLIFTYISADCFKFFVLYFPGLFCLQSMTNWRQLVYVTEHTPSWKRRCSFHLFYNYTNLENSTKNTELPPCLFIII